MPLSGIRPNDPTVWASEDGSCLRLLGYRDRLASERAKMVHALDRTVTVIGISKYNADKILVSKVNFTNDTFLTILQVELSISVYSVFCE
jgi:hypothetical protein